MSGGQVRSFKTLILPHDQSSDNRILTKESVDKTWVYIKHLTQLSNERILSEAISWSWK